MKARKTAFLLILLLFLFSIPFLWVYCWILSFCPTYLFVICYHQCSNMGSTNDASPIWLKLRRLICLSCLLWIILNPSYIPSLSVAPAMTHLAYIRIYLTPKNKKRIMWTATNKTFSYSDTSGSCFPASGVPLMQPIGVSLSSHRLIPNRAKVQLSIHV